MAKADKDITSFMKEVNKVFGENALIKLGDAPKVDIDVIDSGTPILNEILGGGYARGRMVEIYGGESTGKAQPLTSMILTPDGYIKMAEVTRGTKLVNPNGVYSIVDSVHPQGNREVFKITFSDGTVAESTLDHLWTVEDVINGRTFTKTLQEIITNKTTYALPAYSVRLKGYPKALLDRYLKAVADDFIQTDNNFCFDMMNAEKYYDKEIESKIKKFCTIHDEGTRTVYETPNSAFANMLATFFRMRSRVVVERDNFIYLYPVNTKRVFKSVDSIGVVPCQCIKVAHSNGLYITDNFIPTHNTTLALHAVKETMESGGRAAYIDIEHAMNVAYAEQIGVNMGELFFAQPASAEEALNLAETIAGSGLFDLIVIDSVAALVPQKELEGEIGDASMGLQARLMSQACRILAGNLSKSKTCLIFINQIRCVAEDTYVLVGDTYYQIKDVQVGDNIQGKTVMAKKYSGKLPGFKIYSENAIPLTISTNHMQTIFKDFMLTEVRADSLNIGDYLCLPVNEETKPSIIIPNSTLMSPAEMAGVIACVGYIYKDDIYLPATSEYVQKELYAMEHVKLSSDDFIVDKEYIKDFISIKNFGDTLVDDVIIQDATMQEKFDFLVGFLSSAYHDEDSGVTEIAVSKEYNKDLAGVGLLLNQFGVRYDYLSYNKGGIIYIASDDLYKLFFDSGYELRNREFVIKNYGYTYKHQDLVPAELATLLNVSTVDRHKIISMLKSDVYKDLKRILSNHRFSKITKIEKTSAHMYDIEVDGDGRYYANGILTHNSKIGVVYGNPTTTSGGNALKFYASQRLEVSKGQPIKSSSGDVTGHELKIKCVKNKIGAPLKTCVIPLIYGQAIDKNDGLLDLALERGILIKSGSWYSYGDTKLGQGLENTKKVIYDNPDLLAEIKSLIDNGSI